jgi:D-amino-acid oxidase
MSLKKIAIVGAGVTGVTTAILLRLSGYNVQVFSREYPIIDHKNPFFASSFPAASILPHSVQSPISKKLFLSSILFYHPLFEHNFPGIHRQIHYEVFSEAPKSNPSYLPWLTGYTELPVNGRYFIPHLPDNPLSRAWKSSMFFVDWPIYWKALLNTFNALEIPLAIETIDLSQIDSRFPASEYSLAILASGSGFEEKHNKPLSLLKGHLIEISNGPTLRNPDGELFSYNYTPPTKVYSTLNGKAQDIYSYTRSGSMILGGSRIAGHLIEGKWIGDDLLIPCDPIERSLEWPYSAIFERNKILIEHSTNATIDASQIKSQLLGYRYLGPNSSLCFKVDFSKDLPHIHAYGLGGAGVTLSWGLANEILTKTNKLLGTPQNRSVYHVSPSIQSDSSIDKAKKMASYLAKLITV